MKKLLFIFVMMAIWIVASSCSTTQKQNGCYGYWVKWDGLQRGTRWSNKFNKKPYRQCVDGEVPHKNGEKRPYG